MRFGEKVCLVTGGASGIGRATCQLFAAEGARVAVVDSDESAGQKTADELINEGKLAHYVHADVALPGDVRSAVAEVIDRWQRIDVLVNCAATMTFQPVTELAEDEWDRVISTNLRAVFLFCKYSLPHMTRGAIVNVSSVHAHRSIANVASYAASKGGVEAFTRVLALECEELGVRVNSIAPGAVDTPMLWSNPLVQSGEEKIGRAVGRPEDVASAIAFLASAESSFISGVSLLVDGGRLARL